MTATLFSLLLVVGLLTVSCGDGDGPPEGGPPPFSDVVEGLCATEQVLPDEPEGAARIFTDRVHDGLHELADRVSEEDRAVAASLLEAKQEVESGLAHGEDGAALLEDVAHLRHRTIVAVEALGEGTPACAGT